MIESFLDQLLDYVIFICNGHHLGPNFFPYKYCKFVIWFQEVWPVWSREKFDRLLPSPRTSCYHRPQPLAGVKLSQWSPGMRKIYRRQLSWVYLFTVNLYANKSLFMYPQNLDNFNIVFLEFILRDGLWCLQGIRIGIYWCLLLGLIFVGKFIHVQLPTAHKSISTHVFEFNLPIKINLSVKIHHINRGYFVEQIVRCYDQYVLVRETIHRCLI